MNDFQKNIVPSDNQNAFRVFRHDGSGIRILFVGNSITRHAPKPEIGWFGDCGMAATDIEHDYVHVFMNKVWEIDPNAGYCMAQVADVERQYDNQDVLQLYDNAVDFEADIVIMFFGANVPKEKCDPDPEQVAIFADTYRKMRDMFRNGYATIFHVEGFYIRPVIDEAKKKVAMECGDTFICLGDIRTRADTHGMFNHPNDKGMEEIAERLWEYVLPILRKSNCSYWKGDKLK